MYKTKLEYIPKPRTRKLSETGRKKFAKLAKLEHGVTRAQEWVPAVFGRRTFGILLDAGSRVFPVYAKTARYSLIAVIPRRCPYIYLPPAARLSFRAKALVLLLPSPSSRPHLHGSSPRLFLELRRPREGQTIVHVPAKGCSVSCGHFRPAARTRRDRGSIR